jgi:HAMP domain-containing protein
MTPVDLSTRGVSSPGARWPLLDPRHSLRAQSALLFGGVALLLTALAGGLATHSYRIELERRTGDLLAMLAFESGDKAERITYERQSDLQVVANAPAFRSGGSIAQQRATMDALLDASPDFAWIGFATSAGTVVAGTQHLFEGERADRHPWFLRGQNQSFVGELKALREVAQLTNTADLPDSHFFDLGVPVRNEEGKLVGVVGAYLRSSWAPVLQQTVLTTFSRRDHMVGTFYSAKGEALFGEETGNSSAAPPLPERASNGQPRGAFVEYTSDGAVFLTGYSRTHGFRGASGLNWLVTVREPLAEVFAPADGLRRTLIVVGATICVGFAIMGWCVATPISRQLRRIAATARRIQAGDVLATLPSPAGQGELARACAALRDLIEHLRGR